MSRIYKSSGVQEAEDRRQKARSNILFSPVTNHQSPIPSHQSPITNHQSPITNHQSPITLELLKT
ncbi:hypothetical protein [Sphaerospermopsis reniformis]|uniref:hypothetical protein n=1 Tax=Sphaerospermopsis reniformis TaxID=531300 RepID=UPI001396CCBA|nr:hypothetical protein [Sphaerospermopsis reniformis]